MSTKQAIIAEAMTLLKQTGYRGWSYDHISKKVGIRKASIHYYFPTKDSLVSEILQIYINNLFARLEVIQKNSQSHYEKLQSLIRCYQSNYESPHEICLCTILASDYQMLANAIRDQLDEFYEKLYQWVCLVLKEGIAMREFKPHLDEQALACFLVQVLQGLLITSKLPSHKRSFELCMRQLDLVLLK